LQTEPLSAVLAMGQTDFGRTNMNWDRIKGQWRQWTGRLKSSWGKATDDDATNMVGKRQVLIGKLQERYGVLKDDAEKQVDGALAKVLPNG
jgi:uncharacterized protein YjbJ (UPF0337 family)